MLIENGYQVDVAANGQEALILLNSKQYSCIVTDINMPGISGIELAAHIRSNETTKCIPIIALTANPSVKIKKECISAGVNAVATKPINSSDLDNLIQKVTHRD